MHILKNFQFYIKPNDLGTNYNITAWYYDVYYIIGL